MHKLGLGIFNYEKISNLFLNNPVMVKTEKLIFENDGQNVTNFKFSSP